MSLNSLIQTELGDAVQAEHRRRIRESFEALASDPDQDMDVEWMAPLQCEALELSDAAAEEG